MAEARLTIVGDESWPEIARFILSNLGCKNIHCVSLDTHRFQGPVHFGLGDSFERSRLLFGDELANSIWEVTGKNFARAKAILNEMKIPVRESELVRFISNPIEMKAIRDAKLPVKETTSPEKELGWIGRIDEPCLVWDPDELSVSDPEQVVSFRQAKDGIQINLASGVIESDAVLVVSEWLPAIHFESISDRLIPVTLPQFQMKGQGPEGKKPFLLNGGADYAFPMRDSLMVGSYRNLFSDAGAGIQTRVDEKNKNYVESYFRKLGWACSIEKDRLTVESITCDGLPIVGPLSEFPEVFLCSGFSARGQNFLFEVLHQLGRGLMGLSSFDDLDKFSIKRFV